MSEQTQKRLSDGRRLWVEQECHDMARAWKDQDKTRTCARSDILRTLDREMHEDGYNILFYQQEVEQILDRELDNVYQGTTTH